MLQAILNYITGFGLGTSLIIAIGAQNAYLLGQAIRAQHALMVAAICSVVDIILIVIGIAGMGTFIERNPTLLWFITAGGSLFLFVYGWLAFKRALLPAALRADEKSPTSRKDIIITTLALSLLNPNVYLDTVLLLGSMGARLEAPGPLWFGLGAATGSVVWFFSLAITGRYLSRWLREPRHWQKLDILIGMVMWTLAISLSRSLQ